MTETSASLSPLRGPLVASASPVPTERGDAQESRLICAPGSHLIEVEVRRPCTPEVLTLGLERMGWSDVMMDQSRQGAGRVAAKSDAAVSTVYRFIARLNRHLLLQQRDDLVWLHTYRFEKLDPLSEDLKYGVRYFRLERDTNYEIQFFSRLRAQPTRESICAALDSMRWWRSYKISAIKKDTRIPGRPGASVTMWAGVARWTGPRNYITSEDPVYFEDVVPV